MVYRRLKELQEQNNFTNQQVAESIGRSRQWYSDIFINKTLKIEDLRALAKMYNVPMSIFFEDTYQKGQNINDSEDQSKDHESIRELISTNRKSLEALLGLTIELNEIKKKLADCEKENATLKSKLH